MLAAVSGVSGCALPPRSEPAARVAPLIHAHAHNDYEHPRPLLDALDHGFNSVEADIHLVNGELLVGHDSIGLRAERTLDALYLRPLRERIRAQGGRVYPGPETSRPFILLIDIKTEADNTYAALHERLQEYGEMLTSADNGRVRAGPVIAIISGNRPVDMIRQQPVCFAAIDGRLDDLGSDAPAHLIPLISASWSSVFSWRGSVPMPTDQRARLRQIVERAHAQGRWVRFWGAPDTREVWQLLLDESVDLINTDRLAELRAFLAHLRWNVRHLPESCRRVPLGRELITPTSLEAATGCDSSFVGQLFQGYNSVRKLQHG